MPSKIYLFSTGLHEQGTSFDLASITGRCAERGWVGESPLPPCGSELPYLYLVPKLMIAAIKADQFLLLGIILKTSSPQKLLADFLPATSAAFFFFFFLRKSIHCVGKSCPNKLQHTKSVALLSRDRKHLV